MAITKLEIEKKIKGLDFKWYKSKLAFFRLEKDYDQERDVIIIKYNFRTVDFEDSLGNEHREDIFDVIEITFLQYCFDTNFQGSLYQNNETIDEWGPAEIYKLPVDFAPIQKDILNYVDQEFKGILELQYRYKTLSTILNKIRELLNNFENEDECYVRLKSEILFNLEEAIKSKHGNIISKFEEFTLLKKERKILAKKESDKQRYEANKIAPGSLKKDELNYTKFDIEELEHRIRTYFGTDKRKFEVIPGSLHIFFNELCMHSENFTPFIITIKRIPNFYYLISRIHKHIEKFDYRFLHAATNVKINKKCFNKEYIDDYPTRADINFKVIIDEWIESLK